MYSLFRDFVRWTEVSAGLEQLEGLFHRDRKSSWSTAHNRVNLYCSLQVPSTPWFIVVYAFSSTLDAEVVLLYITLIVTYITYQRTKGLYVTQRHHKCTARQPASRSQQTPSPSAHYDSHLPDVAAPFSDPG